MELIIWKSSAIAPHEKVWIILILIWIRVYF